MCGGGGVEVLKFSGKRKALVKMGGCSVQRWGGGEGGGGKEGGRVSLKLTFSKVIFFSMCGVYVCFAHLYRFYQYYCFIGRN